MGSGASMSATSIVHTQLGQSQQPKFYGKISGTREGKIDFHERGSHSHRVVITRPRLSLAL